MTHKAEIAQDERTLETCQTNSTNSAPSGPTSQTPDPSTPTTRTGTASSAETGTGSTTPPGASGRTPSTSEGDLGAEIARIVATHPNGIPSGPAAIHFCPVPGCLDIWESEATCEHAALVPVSEHETEFDQIAAVDAAMSAQALAAWRSADARAGLSDYDALLQHADALTRWSERLRMAMRGDLTGDEGWLSTPPTGEHQ